MKTSSWRISFPTASPSFALICVLALVSLAALSTTAFLANARLERLSARTIGDQARLDLALTFGANLTLGQMSKMDAAWNWITFLKKEDTNGTGYLFLGIPYAGTNAANLTRWACFPLFSPANVTNIDSTNPIDASRFAFTNMNQAAFADANASNGLNITMVFPANNPDKSVSIPLLGSRTSPPVSWITNRSLDSRGSNVPTFRFAYFTEDVEGLFQADRMGAVTNRSTGTNGEEISLLSFVQGSNASSLVRDFIAARKGYLTPGTMVTIFSNSANLKPLAQVSNAQCFSVGTRAMNGNSPDVAGQSRSRNYVPAGLGYAAAYANPNGTNKMNLNSYLDTSSQANISSNVAAIAGWIGTNLPVFASTRAGGFFRSGGGGATNTNAFTTNAYLRTLAANIIDYADANSTPSTDGTGISTNLDRPVFRGVDSCPWVNEYVTRFNLFSTNATNIGGVTGRAIIIQTTEYIEIWNPSSQACTGNLTFVAINRQPMSAGFSSFNFTNPLWATNAQGAGVTGGMSPNSTNITLNPNQFLVIGFPTVTNCFFYPAANLTLPLTFPDDINSSYRVAWNNVYYDGGLGGLRRQSKTLSAINGPKWSGTCPGFVGENLASSTFWNMSGDPRATLYQSPPQSAISYDTRSSFGGRNYRAGLTTFPYGEVKPSLWPDGGHNSPAGNLPPSGVNSLPTSTPLAAYTNCPPSRITNAGYAAITELGNIFDPIQWFDPNGRGSSSGYGNDGGQWTNLTPTAVASNVYGGGTSLRIGRAELGKFAWSNITVSGSNVPVPNMQASAAALLDLFCTATNYDDGGKINLNTAPPRVLKALAYGIMHSSDAAILPASLKTNGVPTAAVDAFVKGVTNFRAQYPFLSPSQLGFIWTSGSLPNTNNWPSGSVFGNTSVVPATEWDDSAAEEWFGKIYGLSKVGSRNWRVYCVAQLLNTNGTAKGGIVRRYFDLVARQNNNANPTISGFISGQAPY